MGSNKPLTGLYLLFSIQFVILFAVAYGTLRLALNQALSPTPITSREELETTIGGVGGMTLAVVVFVGCYAAYVRHTGILITQIIISILIALCGIRAWSLFGLSLLPAARVTRHHPTLAESCP